MWLINTYDYSLQHVVEAEETHPYAILSHTWDEREGDPLHGEVTFRDIHNLPQAKRKTGWVKIARTCHLARERDLKWAWIDTCCIDKSSSAELSEAINSMFRWYREAKVCFVYLFDLPARPSMNIRNHTEHAYQDNLEVFFPKCYWFKRGWTLQELIAPTDVEFYDTAWKWRGTKATLCTSISTITGIDEEVLLNSNLLSNFCVARKMYWASNRVTKRVEDVAYSLLGIFDINMPLIYGEGNKAFIRLQEAIAQQTDDMTMFAWLDEGNLPQTYHGIFARSPKDFKRSANIVPHSSGGSAGSEPFTITNQGVRLYSELIYQDPYEGFWMPLRCSRSNENDSRYLLGIRILKTLNGYVRQRATDFHTYHFLCQYESPAVVTIPRFLNAFDAVRTKEQLARRWRLRPVSCSEVTLDVMQSSGPLGFTKSQLTVPRKQLSNALPPSGLTGSTGFADIVLPSIRHEHPNIFYPQRFGIVYGLEEVSGSSGVDLKPWAYAVGLFRDNIVPHDGTSGDNVYRTFEISINDERPYTQTKLNLLRQVLKSQAEGKKFATRIEITPHISSSDSSIDKLLPSEAILLSLQITTSQEKGLPMHEIVVKLEHRRKPSPRPPEPAVESSIVSFTRDPSRPENLAASSVTLVKA